MLTRAFVAAALIIAAGMSAGRAAAPERAPARTPLAQAPLSLDKWSGHEAPPFPDDVIEQLGVDDYINRLYVSASGIPVSVYIGYYASQRRGDTIHSPQNCLPGAGWRPVLADRSHVALGRREVPVNRFVIQKGMDRQVVYYWFQGRGRTVANEFANKGWLMFDAARLRRTDGGLVRLITPVTSTEDAAFATLNAFTTVLFPHLAAHLP